MNKEEEIYLSEMGLTFPSNEEELIAFDKQSENYDYELSEDSIDPFKILKECEVQYREVKKATNVDYHKRTVLAAEIVYQLENDNSLGHLKLQKLMFLCQQTSKMNLHTNFLKQAMGPYDPILMRSIDSQFKKRGWFKFSHENFPKYQRLDKCGEHKEWFEKYFIVESHNITFVIETFRKFTTKQIELVGTIYACWQKALANKSIVSDQLLIRDVYEWHKSKKDKFSESQIIAAIGWMNEKGVFPEL